MKGKLIVLYGINNLGKSTQAKRLVERLNREGRNAKYLKYPIYELEPSGVMLNEYLRKGNPANFTPREAQMVYAWNRSQYEPILESDLASGVDIVAEDYWGTGVAWGMGRGVEKDFLLRLNKDFIREDVAILLSGKRFEESIENDHLHETNRELTDLVDKAHQVLAKEFGWKVVQANKPVEKVAEEIWNIVKASVK